MLMLMMVPSLEFGTTTTVTKDAKSQSLPTYVVGNPNNSGHHKVVADQMATNDSGGCYVVMPDLFWNDKTTATIAKNTKKTTTTTAKNTPCHLRHGQSSYLSSYLTMFEMEDGGDDDNCTDT